MENKNEITYIDEKVAAFCRDKSTYAINISKLSNLLCKDQVLIKLCLTDDVVALLVMNKGDFRSALEVLGYGDVFPYLGFYIVSVNKFFFSVKAQNILLCKENNMPIPIHYEWFPFSDMNSALRKEVAKRLARVIPHDDIDIFDKKACRFAMMEYFSGRGKFEPNTTCDFRAVLKKKDTEMSEVSKFMTNPEKWVQDTCEKVFANKTALKKAKREFVETTRIYNVCKQIHMTPEHPWNKAERFASAIEGRETVVIRFKKGEKTCDFCVRPYAFGFRNGKGDVAYRLSERTIPSQSVEVSTDQERPVMHNGVPTGKTCKWIHQFLRKRSFNIEDVDSVMYDGKVIYHN